MTLLHFPNSLTEEEETLKQALQKLKKKKKMLQSLKAAAQSQEKETAHSKKAGKQAPPPASGSAGKATEQAKKLVQSGAIKVAELKEKSGFKRSKNLEKKLKETDKTAAPVGFQPFHAFSGDDDEEKQPPSKRVKGLNESFVPAGGYANREYGRDRDHDRERGERDLNDRPPRDFNDRPPRDFNDRPPRDFNDRPPREYREPPKKGHTIYVRGVGVTEPMLRKFFASYGNIVNVAMETDRGNAFITFDKMESADQAIAEANGANVSNIQLLVQMARRQRPIETIVEGASSSSSWSSTAASNSQKGSNKKESRQLMSYDADDLF